MLKLGVLLCLIHGSAAIENGGVMSVECEKQGRQGDPPVQNCKLAPGHIKSALAFGRFDDALEKTGWSQLWVTTTGDEMAHAFATGYLEGALTHTRIYHHHSNVMKKMFSSLPNATQQALFKFVDDNRKWISSQMQTNQSSYWTSVAWIYHQLDGMVQGYNDYKASSEPSLDRTAFDLLQLQGDARDIILKVAPKLRPDFARMTDEQIAEYLLATSHCSAIVKLTATYDELFVGHTMWWGYYAMLRVFKHYTFTSFGAARTMQLSSLPGTLASIDDFYQLGNGLVVMETTNPCFNNTLFDKIHPETVLYWVRVLVANLMATNGLEWMEKFQLHNSGTYNNMWMVVDYNKFTPGEPLPDKGGVLVVGEQLPEYFHFEDQTHTLSYGHWPSYNSALYPETKMLSGQNEMVAKYGTGYSHDLTKRAEIFRRDAGKIATLEDAQKFIRYNKWQTDPLAAGDPCNQIACRGDLRAKPVADGALDGKMTSYSLYKNASVKIVSGPTHDDQIVFDWSTAPAVVQAEPHMGQPGRFDFDWIEATL